MTNNTRSKRKDYISYVPSKTPLEIKSSIIAIHCGGCGYTGSAKAVMGRTEYPLLKCPQCNRLVQSGDIRR